MNEDIDEILKMLSSKSVVDRKQAIKALKPYIHGPHAHMLRLSLHYISEHDPSYTVRNLAKQAFYMAGVEPPPHDAAWERVYAFEVTSIAE